MQTCWFPATVCDDIDRLCRRFLWGSLDEGKGIHLVSWKSVTSPKKAGGLGLRTARDNNIVMLGKLVWSILSNEDKPWVKVLCDRYLHGGSLFDARFSGTSSHVWRAILKASTFLRDAFMWRIGTGQNVALWEDRWLGAMPLRFLVDNISLADSELCVADIISVSGGIFLV